MNTVVNGVPSFSVVVPSHARPRQLRDCLHALARVDYPRDGFETIVVQDGGPAPPEEYFAELRARSVVTVVTQVNAGPSAARNAGAFRATGDWVVFIDDDCAPAPDYLQRLADRAAGSPCVIGGQSVNALVDNPYSAASQFLLECLYAYYDARNRGLRFFTSNNLALPRALFEEIGGFDLQFRRPGAEDRDLCSRLVARGYELLFAPEAVVYHSHDLTPIGFLKQHFAYGRGAYRFHRKRAAAAGVSLTVEPPSFYWNLLSSPFRRPEVKRPALTAVLLFASQVANGAGFVWEAARHFRG